MDRAFLIERITKIKERIIAYEDAMLAISTGAIEEYRIDTGQTKTTVKKSNIKTIQDVIDGMLNQLCVYQTRLNGGGTITVQPAW